MTPLEELTDLLGLKVRSLHVAWAKTFGCGSLARVVIGLSDESALRFDTLAAMARPAALMAELAAVAGVCPQLKPSQCFRAIALIRDIAETTATLTEAEIALDWGSDYLQDANVVDVGLDDQAERWGAFVILDKCDPYKTAAIDGTTLARASIVLRDRDGALLVRSGWFRDHVRKAAPRISHTEIAPRMAEVGWAIPKRVKATNPNGANCLQWSFHVVPANWGHE
jgi:hypothetical protein